MCLSQPKRWHHQTHLQKFFKYYCALENNRVEGDLKLACVAAALVATQRSNEHEKLVELNASSFIFAI